MARPPRRLRLLASADAVRPADEQGHGERGSGPRARRGSRTAQDPPQALARRSSRDRIRRADLEFAWREDVDIDAANRPKSTTAASATARRRSTRSATARATSRIRTASARSRWSISRPVRCRSTSLEAMMEQKLNPPEPTVVGPDGKPLTKPGRNTPPNGKNPGGKGGKPPVTKPGDGGGGGTYDLSAR
jgi:hypothetical protein